MKKTLTHYPGKYLLSSLLVLLFSSFFLNGFAQNDALRMRITSLSNSYSDETVMRFLNGATTGYDSSYDAWKMFSPNQNVPAFYTLLDGSALSVNAYPELDQDWQFDLHYRANATGDYLIEMEEALPFTMPVTFYMLDKHSGITYSYSDFPLTLHLEAYSDTIARFSVIFSLPANISVEDISCYGAADGAVTIDKPGSHQFEYRIEDENGQIVQNNSDINETEVITGLHAGNYTLILNAYGIDESYSAPVTEPPLITADFAINQSAQETENGMMFDFTNLSLGAVDFHWDFGDGNSSLAKNPGHQYSENGNYAVMLTAYDSSGNCSYYHSDTVKVNIEMNVGLTELKKSESYLSWSSADQTISINPGFQMNGAVKVIMYDLSGRTVLLHEGSLNGKDHIRLQVTASLEGIYILKLENNTERFYGKVYVQ